MCRINISALIYDKNPVLVLKKNKKKRLNDLFSYCKIKYIFIHNNSINNESNILLFVIKILHFSEKLYQERRNNFLPFRLRTHSIFHLAVFNFFSAIQYVSFNQMGFYSLLFLLTGKTYLLKHLLTTCFELLLFWGK